MVGNDPVFCGYHDHKWNKKAVSLVLHTASGAEWDCRPHALLHFLLLHDFDAISFRSS
jgi:hypothetical protein